MEVLPPLHIRVQPATRHYGPEEAYKNESEPRGAVFIGNFREFDDEKTYKPRLGSEQDVCHLKDLFTQIGYKIFEGIEDETKERTLEALTNFREELRLHNELDSLIVIFMSHGNNRDEFAASDGELIHYKEIYNMFSNDNCPALKDKPKLFMFQFCRGTERITPAGTLDISKKTAKITDSPLPPRKRSAQVMSDAYVCLSTIEGFVSYRDIYQGSYFFYNVCQVFMEHAKDKHLNALIKRVIRELPTVQKAELKELAVPLDFYFNPPLDPKLESKCFPPAVKTEEDSSIRPTQGTCKSPNCVPGFTDSMIQETVVKTGTEDTYEMSSNPRGLVLIINNISGCQNDINDLKYLFENLEFRVLQPLQNITYGKLMEELESFKQKDHHDSAIIIFYGNGFEESIVSFDDIAINFQDLTNLFNDINCPRLSEKPKIFIVNTCFTDTFSLPKMNPIVDKDQPHSSSSSRDSENMVQDIVKEVPADRDILIFSVEIDGGCCEHGSLLTDALYQVLLASESNTKELSHVLRLVSNRLNVLSKGKKEQYFTEISNIRFQKEFYFNPSKLGTIDATRWPSQLDTIDAARWPSLKRARNYKYDEINIQEIKQLRMGDNIYNNTSCPHGKAIIICYTTYKSDSIPNCDWRKDDGKMLKELVEKLGYNTEFYINLTAEDVHSTLQKFSNSEEYNKLDSTIVIVLGHAHDVDHFYDTNGQHLPVADILAHFTDDNCPSLKTKAKIFLFHMTQLKEWGSTSIALPDYNLRDAFSLYLISTLQENNEHPTEGLWVLRKALESYAHTKDLESIIMKAEERLFEGGHNGYEQIIRKPVKFMKDFYFNPKSLTP